MSELKAIRTRNKEGSVRSGVRDRQRLLRAYDAQQDAIAMLVEHITDTGNDFGKNLLHMLKIDLSHIFKP